MINNISVEALEKLGIYELRNVARQIGVYSPTLYKKDELIAKVMNIVSGEEQPYVKKTNQGRPPKQIAGLEDILNIFVPEIKNPNQTFAKTEEPRVYTLNRINNTTIIDENKEDFSGIVKLQQGYAVVFKNGYYENNQNTYYVAPKLFNQLSLKDCDFVKGQIYKSTGDDPQMVYTILTVNNVSVTVLNNNRQDFEKLSAIYPNKRINLNVNNIQIVDFNLIDKMCPIGKGSRVKINYEPNIDIDEFVVSLASTVSFNNNLGTTILAVDERPEDISFVKQACSSITVLENNTNIKDEYFVEFMFNKIDNIIRQVELNKSHVLIIKDVEKLKNYLTNYYIINNSCDKNAASVFAHQKLKSILMLAKNTEEGKSLTIIAFNCKDEELSQLFNNNIYLKDFVLEDTDVHLDINNSNSLKSNLILQEEELKKLEKFKHDLKTKDLKSALLKFIG